MEELRLNHYQVIYNKSVIHKSDNFVDILKSVYFDLANNLPVSDISINTYSMNSLISVFFIKISPNGLVIYNNTNSVSVALICPEVMAMDKIICEWVRNKSEPISNPAKYNQKNTTDTNQKPYNQVSTENVRRPVENVRRPRLHAKNMLAHTVYNISNKNVANKSCGVSDKSSNVPDKSSITDVNLIVQDVPQKIRLFESDKRAYIMMSSDIANGDITKQNINPAFEMKYAIFKILENRGSLNRMSAENIDTECELFNSLYNECIDNTEAEPVEKVYVPHNYHYMTADQKTDHAKKYKLTKQQFEEKYINVKIAEDDIEKCINSTYNTTAKTDTNADVGTKSGTDIDKLTINTSSSSDSDTDTDSLDSDTDCESSDTFKKMRDEYNLSMKSC